MHTCFHEAGHALVAVVLGFDLQYVEIYSENSGYTCFHRFKRDDLLEHAALNAGGPLAELYFCPTKIAKCHRSKLAKSFLNVGKTTWALCMAWQGDYDEVKGSGFADEGEAIAKEILARPYAEPAISAIARALSETRYLNGREVVKIIDTERGGAMKETFSFKSMIFGRYDTNFAAISS